MISIITPVLNGEAFIEKNILSISQLKLPYEHIIVDGGSTDNTVGIIRKYNHIKLINQEANNGMYDAIRIGFESSKYDYITYVNCDDQIFANNFNINRLVSVYLMKNVSINAPKNKTAGYKLSKKTY